MGVETFILKSGDRSLASKWRGLAAAVIYELTEEDESIRDQNGKIVGSWSVCDSGQALKALESR
jgi:hypothetical protein